MCVCVCVCVCVGGCDCVNMSVIVWVGVGAIAWVRRVCGCDSVDCKVCVRMGRRGGRECVCV